MKISKILSYLVLVVGVIAAILLFNMSSGLDALMIEAGAEEARELPLGASIPQVSPLYGLAVVIIVVLLIATLITIFSGLIKNPASLKKTIIGIVAFLVVIGISYGLAEGKEVLLNDGRIIDAGTSKWSGAGIKAFYISAILAVGAIIWSGVKKAISK